MPYSLENYPGSANAQARSEVSARFMSRVYIWMMVGILLTAAVAYGISNNPYLMSVIAGQKYVFIGLVIAQLAAVMCLSFLIKKMNAFVASSVYLLYSALTGLTFSVIFLAYTQQSIVSAFAVTAFSFGGLSAFGYITKRDLGPIGSFCTMGLFGLIGIMLLSLFVPSLMGGVAQQVISSIGVIVFAGLTAYDTQRIKAIRLMDGSECEMKKAAVHGALVLYLDFINLFLSILRLMGGRR